MTKATPLKQKPSQAPRKKRGTNNAGGSQLDACEMLVAELQARRERLQHLLAMIHLEAGRVNLVRVPVQSRRKCSATRRKTAA
jgi:hypothetical protein